MKRNQNSEGSALVEIIVHGMQEKKAANIVSLDLRQLKSRFADFMVICHGGSDRQVEAIADSVEDEVRKALSEKPFHREGSDKSEWILLDYVNVVVHVFSEEKRSFYAIEELWGDAEAKYFE